MFDKLTRLSAAALLTLAASATQAQTPTVRIQDTPGIAGTLGRVAIEKGYCAKYGIQCTIQTIAAAPLGVQTLLAGGIEVALAPPEVVIQSMNKGADLKVVGGAMDVSPFMLLVGPTLYDAASKGYPGIMASLKGKKIGVTARGAAPEFQIKTMLQDAGMKPDDVTFVAVGSANTAYPALINNQVDAVMGFVPFDGFCEVMKTCRIALTLAKNEGPKALTDINGAGGFYVMRRDYLIKNPVVAESLTKALRDAERFVAEASNVNEVMQITLKYFKIDAPKGDEVLRNSMDRYRAHFKVDVRKDAVQAAANYLQQTGQLDKPFDAGRLF